MSKRSREASPTENQQKKESKQETSPPNKRSNKQETTPLTKKNYAVAYSSTSDEEETTDVEEQIEMKGMPIPTIVTTNPRGTQDKERIPNPFRREDVTQRQDHPLRSQSQSPKRHINDLEGVRDEIKKMYENREKPGTPHPRMCGCETCFWDEKEKIGKLTEKRITELIENFVKHRDPNTIPSETKHSKVCLCMLCIKRKVEENKEAITKELMNKKEQTQTRDPRMNKEKTGTQ